MLYALNELFTSIDNNKKRSGVLNTKTYIVQVKKSNSKVKPKYRGV